MMMNVNRRNGKAQDGFFMAEISLLSIGYSLISIMVYACGGFNDGFGVLGVYKEKQRRQKQRGIFVLVRLNEDERVA